MKIRSITSLRITLFAAFTGLTAISQPARAHDIVLVPGTNQLTVRYGHPGDWLSIDDERLLEVKSLSAAGASVDIRDDLKRRGLVLHSGQPLPAPALIAARYDNGLWLKAPVLFGAKEQWRNASKYMFPEGSDAMSSLKFAKAAVLSATDTSLYRQSVGHLLELIPQKNPATLRGNELLPVLVRFNSKPLPDAGIEVSDLKKVLPEDKIVRYKTDGNGIAQVPVIKRGLNVLAVDFKHPNDGSLGTQAKALPVEQFLIVATYSFTR